MSTRIRPAISDNNKYYVPKHRYYELKHFCLQYHDWKKEYALALDLPSKSEFERVDNSSIPNLTLELAEKRIYFKSRIEMVEKTAIEAGGEILGPHLLLAVIDNLSYEHLRLKYNIPYGRDLYYVAYRRFFWLLDKARN